MVYSCMWVLTLNPNLQQLGKNIIPRPGEALETDIRKCMVVHLHQEYTNKLPFTSYTTLTPHNRAKMNFHAYVTSCISI